MVNSTQYSKVQLWFSTGNKHKGRNMFLIIFLILAYWFNSKLFWIIYWTFGQGPGTATKGNIKFYYPSDLLCIKSKAFLSLGSVKNSICYGWIILLIFKTSKLYSCDIYNFEISLFSKNWYDDHFTGA